MTKLITDRQKSVLVDMGLMVPKTKGTAYRLINFVLNGNVYFQGDKNFRLNFLKKWQKLIGHELEFEHGWYKGIKAKVIEIYPRTNEGYNTLDKDDPELHYHKHPFKLKVTYYMNGKKYTKILPYSEFKFSLEQKEILGIKK